MKTIVNSVFSTADSSSSMARHMNTMNVRSQVGSCWLLDGRITGEPFQDMMGSSEASMRRKQMGIRSNKHGKVKEAISRDKRNAEPVWRWMDLADYWNSPSWDKVTKAEVHLTYHCLLYSSLQFIGDRPKKLAFRLPSSEVWRPLGVLDSTENGKTYTGWDPQDN